jgi:hypothetical protein
MKDAPAPGGSNAMKAYKSVLQSEYEASLLDNSWNGSMGTTSNHKSYLDDQHSKTSSINNASTALSTSTEATKEIDCKYCKKYGRTKPHPVKVPVKKCMFNRACVGLHFANGCKTMKLEYNAAEEFKKRKNKKWPKDKKKEAKEEK